MNTETGHGVVRVNSKAIPISRALSYFVLLLAAILGTIVCTLVAIRVEKTIALSQEENIRSQIAGDMSEFSIFFKTRQSLLQDHADFPIMTQGVMQPEQSHGNVKDFMDELLLLGETYQITLLDFEGKTIHATVGIPRFNYVAMPWVRSMTENKIDTYLTVSSYEGSFYWRMAVPVKYHGFAEGVLVAEIPIEEISRVHHLDDRLRGVRLQIMKGDDIVAAFGKLGVPPYSETILDRFGLRFQYQFDSEAADAARDDLLVQIVFILIVVTAITVVASIQFGRNYFAAPLQDLRLMTSNLANSSRVTPVPVDQKITELVDLAVHFNVMTDRVQKREEALRRSEERYKAVVESADSAIISFDKSNRIVAWNRAAQLYFGYTADEAIGEFFSLLIPTRYRKDHGEEVKRFGTTGLAEKVNTALEWLVLKKSGEEFPVELTLARWSTSEGTFVTAIIRDITRRKRAQDALQQSKQDLEKINRELKANQAHLVHTEKMAGLGQLAAGVAHEINNPVGYVKSNLSTMTDYVKIFKTVFDEYELLAKQLRSDESFLYQKGLSKIEELCSKEDLPYILDDVDKLLSESMEGTERVKEIVQSLKSFARLDEAVVKEADINEGLETTLKVVGNELKYKCRVHKKYGRIPLVRCYPGQLNQVFMNLLINAAQAIENSGEITIETEATTDHVVIRIMDTGKGIAPENIPKIFEPFYTTKEVGSGTGLGLSISDAIIRKHNGTIDLESELDKGTTFTIRLPIKGVRV